MPDSITRDSVVYSFGIGEDASFEAALIERFGVTVHAFDPTPRSVEWVKAQGFPSQFAMHQVGLAAYDGEATFCPPENPDEVSHTIVDRPSTKSQAITVPVRRLSTIIGELGHDRIDLLKLDIEGAEYTVIEDMLQSGVLPSQLIVEFHHWSLKGMGPGRTRYGRTVHAINALKSVGYVLASNPNNMNLVFVRHAANA